MTRKPDQVILVIVDDIRLATRATSVSGLEPPKSDSASQTLNATHADAATSMRSEKGRRQTLRSWVWLLLLLLIGAGIVYVFIFTRDGSGPVYHPASTGTSTTAEEDDLTKSQVLSSDEETLTTSGMPTTKSTVTTQTPMASIIQPLQPNSTMTDASQSQTSGGMPTRKMTTTSRHPGYPPGYLICSISSDLRHPVFPPDGVCDVVFLLVEMTSKGLRYLGSNSKHTFESFQKTNAKAGKTTHGLDFAFRTIEESARLITEKDVDEFRAFGVLTATLSNTWTTRNEDLKVLLTRMRTSVNMSQIAIGVSTDGKVTNDTLTVLQKLISDVRPDFLVYRTSQLPTDSDCTIRAPTPMYGLSPSVSSAFYLMNATSPDGALEFLTLSPSMVTYRGGQNIGDLCDSRAFEARSKWCPLSSRAQYSSDGGLYTKSWLSFSYVAIDDKHTVSLKVCNSFNWPRKVRWAIMSMEHDWNLVCGVHHGSLLGILRSMTKKCTHL